MKRWLFVFTACLLLGLLAGDIAFGAGCDPLVSAAPGISSGSGSLDEDCGPSACIADCFCCTAVFSGGSAPVVLRPGPLARAITALAPAVREGAPPRLDHPPQL